MSGSALLELPELTASEIEEILSQPRPGAEYATYRYVCGSLSPIMFDRMTDAQVQGLVTGAKVDFPKDEPLAVKAARKMYSDEYKDDMPWGNLGFPATNLYACLRDTGKKVKYGSGTWDTVTSATAGTKLFCMLRLEDDFIVLRDLKGNPISVKWGTDGLPVINGDFRVDCRKGNATQGTGAVGIIRGSIPRWSFAGYLHLAVSGEYVLPEKQLRKLFDMAGVAAGLCSARPGKQMPFGQFGLWDLKWIAGAKPRQVTVSVSNGSSENGDGSAATAKPKRAPRKKKDAVEEAPPEGAPPENGEVALEQSAETPPAVEPNANGDTVVES